MTFGFESFGCCFFAACFFLSSCYLYFHSQEDVILHVKIREIFAFGSDVNCFGASCVEVKLLWFSKAGSCLRGYTGGEAGRGQNCENQRNIVLVCFNSELIKSGPVLSAAMMSHSICRLSVNTSI